MLRYNNRFYHYKKKKKILNSTIMTSLVRIKFLYYSRSFSVLPQFETDINNIHHKYDPMYNVNAILYRISKIVRQRKM